MGVKGIRSECKSALLNIGNCLASDIRFPRNVFIGQWDDFFFFDSDLMFDSAFVEQVKALIRIEGATCACLASLDTAIKSDLGYRRFYIDLSATSDAYRTLLRGERQGEGWIYDMGRFGCASDLCQWAVYCERSSEIAVIAIRSRSAFDNYRLLLSRLKARQITEAVGKPMSYGFAPEALSTAWRSVFLQEYGSSE